jgi:hypothetical protein
MVFGVPDDNLPMRESLKNLIWAVGLRAEVFISAQEFVHSHNYPTAGWIGCGPKRREEQELRKLSGVEGLNRGDPLSGAQGV